MKLAIMQPYFLPYIGYFQLLAAVDKFVVFDDVHYINRGWINRNRLLVNGRDLLFTVPLKGASQNRLICELELAGDTAWRTKLLATLQQNYRKAPNFTATFELVERIIHHPATGLVDYLLNSLRLMCERLGLATELVPSSRRYANQQLKAQDRILDICRREAATEYVNPPGGQDLYDPALFAAAGVQLRFLKPKEIVYRQFGDGFIPWLSIVDVLMFNTPEQARALLDEYTLQ